MAGFLTLLVFLSELVVGNKYFVLVPSLLTLTSRTVEERSTFSYGVIGCAGTDRGISTGPQLSVSPEALELVGNNHKRRACVMWS